MNVWEGRTIGRFASSLRRIIILENFSRVGSGILLAVFELDEACVFVKFRWLLSGLRVAAGVVYGASSDSNSISMNLIHVYYLFWTTLEAFFS